MSVEQLIFGVFSGDMGALSVLFVMLLPIFFVLAAIASLRDRTKGRR